MKKSYLHTLGFIFLLIACSFIILMPLLRPGFIVTDDGDWMVIRLTAFYQAFADGQFPVRFLGRLNNNYGYPVANFLYPGFLYIGSFLRILKISYPAIIEIILGGSVCVSVIFLFLWLKNFFSPLISFFGASTLLISPYFLYDLYKRGSVGELLATACFMVLLWSIESRFVWLIPPVMALFLLSHNTLSLLFGIVLVGYIIIRKKWNTIIPCLIGVGITSFFWIPALFERTFIRFDTIQVAKPTDYKDISQSLLFMSIPFLLPLFLFFKKRTKGLNTEFQFFSVLVIISLVGSTGLGIYFWKSSYFIHFIQFPYRILSIMFIAGPWVLAYLISNLKEKMRVWIGLLIIVFLFFINISLLKNTQSAIREEGFYVTNEGTTTVQDEYMPRWVIQPPRERAFQKVELFSGKGNILTKKSSTKEIEIDLRLLEESIIQVNTVFYPGWGGVLDGKPVEVSYENPQGLMRVTVPKGNHILLFEFRETAFRYVADVLSSISVILYGVYIVFFLTRRVKRKKNI